MHKLQGRLSYANVTATIALFVALAGGAWAALGKDTIGSRELKRNAVRSAEVRNEALKGKDLKDAAINGSKVADGSLSGAELAGDSLGGAQIDESALGTVPDAGALQGRSFAFGIANAASVPAQTILTLPVLGAALETDGDADVAFTFRWVNIRPAGGGSFDFVCGNGRGGIGPGVAASVNVPVASGFTETCLAFDSAAPAGSARTLVFCGAASGSGIVCEALRAP